MTITNNAMNRRLGHLEDCAENAPEGTYAQAKSAVEAIHDLSNSVLSTFRAAGFKVHNDDRLRNVEVTLYAYLAEANPDASELIAAEGFGEAMDGPRRNEIIRRTEQERDALIAARKIFAGTQCA